jgi:hypothetical protein
MKRGLMNSVAMLSMFMLMASVALWIRSYWIPENIGWVRESWPDEPTLRSVSVCLTPMNGKFYFDYTRSEQRLPAEDLPRMHAAHLTGSRLVWRPISTGPGMVLPATNRLGFGWTRNDGIYGNYIQYGWECTTPAWLPVLVFATPLVMWLRFQRRVRKRAAAGHCENCGYDLRASPERCPECGDDVTHSAPGA